VCVVVEIERLVIESSTFSPYSSELFFIAAITLCVCLQMRHCLNRWLYKGYCCLLNAGNLEFFIYISLSLNVNILLNQTSLVQQTVSRFFEGVRNVSDQTEADSQA